MRNSLLYFSSLILILGSWFFSGCANSNSSLPVNDFAKSGAIKYPLPHSKDSLLSILKILPNDSNRVNVLNAIALSWRNKNPDSCQAIYKQAMILGKQLKFKNGVATALANLGVSFGMQSNFPKALDCLTEAEKIEEEINNLKEVATCYGNIGNVYENQSDLQRSLFYYSKALTVFEKIDDKKGIARMLGNIGAVYSSQSEYSKALENYLQALRIDEEIKKQSSIAILEQDIGNTYVNESDYPKALEFFTKSLAINENNKNKFGVSQLLTCIGNVYHFQKNYPKSLAFSLRALKISNEIHDKKNIVTTLTLLGTIYSDENKNDSAQKYFADALAIANEIDDKFGICGLKADIGMLNVNCGKYNQAMNSLYDALTSSDSLREMNQTASTFNDLSILYEKSTTPLPDSTGGQLLNAEQMRLRALHYFKSYVNLRDTLFSEENKKQLVRKELNYEFDKKETTQKAKQDKKDAVAKEELKQKEQQRNYFIGGFALVLILAGFIFRSYRQKQKANEIISHQKLLVEEKQKEILDSIHYAKRIQQSMMPTEKYILKNLNRLKKS